MGERLRWMLLFVTMLGAPTVARAQAPPDAEARSFVDQTAVWVGDPLTFTVQIACAPGIDVLDDDLAGDKLKLEGLEFVSLETARDPASGQGSVRTFRYHLAAYKVDVPRLTVGELSTRYYRVRPGEGIENGKAIGELKIPGIAVAFRSMLPDDQATAQLRDGRESGGRSRLLANAKSIGTGLLAVSVVPVLFWAVALVRERQPRTERRSARRVRHDERTSLQAVRAMDVSAPDGRREAYTKINELVRAHLQDVVGVPGQSLTALEIAPTLSSRTRVPADAIQALLAECDAARYASPDALPSADACRAAIDATARVLSAR